MSKKVYRNSIWLPICIIAFFCILLYGKRAGATASTYVQGMTDGINLGNTYETEVNDIIFGDEEAVATVIDNIADEGYTTIRIPVTLSGHFDEKTGVVEDEFYNTLSPAIDYAIKKDMNVILTMYGDSLVWLRDMEDSASVKKLYKKVWKDIAKHYKSYSKRLSFEGADAPYYDNMEISEQLVLLNEMNKVFVDTVRATGGNNSTRPLFISTLNAKVTEDTCKATASLIQTMKDENVAVSIHYYGLFAFSTNSCGVTTFSDETKQDITDFAKMIEKYFIAESIPVVCTEYGLYGQSTVNSQINHGEMLKYFEFLSYTFKKYKIPALLWDDGSLFNRVSGEWSDKELGELLIMARKSRSATVKRDTVFLSEEMKNQDITLTLHLHGAKVLYVEEDSRYLHNGEEYNVTDSTLTLTSEYLASLYESYTGETGQIAKLTIRFDQGCPVTVYLKMTGTKVLESVSENGDEFTIPVKFNGDTLTSMEAKNKKGNPVGPEKKSAYQEFNYAFIPDYENDTITLTKEFLDYLGESEVMLTFHFLSGDTAEYTIVKNGDTIKEVNYSNVPKSKETVENTPEVSSAPKEEDTRTVTIETGQTGEKIEIPLIACILIIGAVSFLLVLYYLYRRRREEEHYLPPDQQ